MNRKTPMKRSRIKFKPRPRATPEELAHLEAVKAAGCVVEWKNYMKINSVPLWVAVRNRGSVKRCEAHHTKDGDRRRGHFFTFGLTTWRHRGICNEGMGVAAMTATYGVSLFHDAREFHKQYGSDDENLAFEAELLRLLSPSPERPCNPTR